MLLLCIVVVLKRAKVVDVSKFLVPGKRTNLIHFKYSQLQNDKHYCIISTSSQVLLNKINCCILLVTGIQLLFAYPENPIEIWLVILFLSRKKCHAKHFFVLSISMKLCPGNEICWEL